MTHNLDDLHGYAMAPSSIYRSKMTKDEKIVSPVLSAFLDSTGWWKYDLETLAYASGLKVQEVQKAIERLEARELIEYDKEGNISLLWARSPKGWMV